MVPKRSRHSAQAAQSQDRPGRRHPAERSPADRALASQLLDALKNGEDVRTTKVRRLRAAVRAGHYENALKWSVALDRLMAENGEAPKKRK